MIEAHADIQLSNIYEPLPSTQPISYFQILYLKSFKLSNSLLFLSHSTAIVALELHLFDPQTLSFQVGSNHATDKALNPIATIKLVLKPICPMPKFY